MIASMRSLAVTPRGRRTGDFDRERLRLALQQALRRQHVADFGRADAEGEGAERAVRARVAVAADDRLAGLRRAELRTDDVHDAATLVLQADQVDAELGAVHFELPDLFRGRLELDRHAAEDLRRVGRRRVIHRRERAIRPTHLEAARAQHVERLRRGHFVRSGAGRRTARPASRPSRARRRAVPDFLEQRLRGHSGSGSFGSGAVRRRPPALRRLRAAAASDDSIAVDHFEEGAHAGLDDVGGDARAAIAAAVVFARHDGFALRVFADRSRCAPRTCAASRTRRSPVRWP